MLDSNCGVHVVSSTHVVKARFTVRLRRVGGRRKSGGISLGFTVPVIVVEDMKLKAGDYLKIQIEKKGSLKDLADLPEYVKT